MKRLPLDFRLETERLALRAPQEGDMAFVFDATRYPGFNDGMLWEPPASVEECREPFERSIAGWKAGESYVFTMTAKESGKPVGRIGIRACRGASSVGFWTHPKQQGRGFMIEALEAVLRFGFEELDLPVIEACHADWNLASRAVLERCGFRFKHHIEEGFIKHGEWVPEDILAITRQQWLALTGGAAAEKAKSKPAKLEGGMIE